MKKGDNTKRQQLLSFIYSQLTNCYIVHCIIYCTIVQCKIFHKAFVNEEEQEIKELERVKLFTTQNEQSKMTIIMRGAVPNLQRPNEMDTK